MSSISSQTNGAASSGVARKAPLPIPRRNGAYQFGSTFKTAESPIRDVATNVAPSPVISVKKPRLEDFCGPDRPPTGRPLSCHNFSQPRTVDQSKAVTGPFASQSLHAPDTRRSNDVARFPAAPKDISQIRTLDPRRRPPSSVPAMKRHDSEEASSLYRPPSRHEVDHAEPMDTDEPDLKDTCPSPQSDETAVNDLRQTPLDKATADIRELGGRVQSGRTDDGTSPESGADRTSSTKPALTPIRRFLEKCGLGQHCDAYVVHFKNIGIPTCQDLDALILYNLDGQLLNLLKKDCNGRWLQINLIKNGLEKHRRALLRKKGRSPAAT